MIPEQQAKIRQSIDLLQQVLGVNSSTTNTQVIKNQQSGGQGSFSDFQTQLKVFQAKGKQIGGQIDQMTTAAVAMFKLSLDYVRLSKTCKQPDQQTTKKIQQMLKAKAEPIFVIQRQDQWKHHGKAIKQIINASFWIFTPSPEFVFDGAIEGSEFNANRFRVQKVMPINQWYNMIFAAVKSYKREVLMTFRNGITYNNNGTGSWNDLLNGNVVSQPSQPTIKSASQGGPKTQQPLVPVKKSPSKTTSGGNWFVSNFEGQTIEFSAEEAVMRSAFFIENCTKCVIKIDKSKFKSVMVSKCENINLIIRDCISGVEIMNSKQIQVQVLGLSPSISVDKSEKIHVVLNGLNKETDILSSKVTQLNISYTIPNSDNLAKDQPVPQQIVTRWNNKNNRFESVVYDKFI